MERPSYIIIHGHGGTLNEVMRLPQRFQTFECSWNNGLFYIPKLVATPLRRLLTENEDKNTLFGALRKIAISRMLEASLSPSPIPENIDKMGVFRESTIIENFPSFSIPIGYESRKSAVSRLKDEGEKEFTSIFSVASDTEKNIETTIQRLNSFAKNSDGSEKTEDDVFNQMNVEFQDNNSVESLIELREMEEVGGDLDTVSSAVFYAHYLLSEAKKSGKSLQYGKDYRFVFINYHEGLRALSELPPGNIYMADMPISTIPHLEEDLKHLKSKELNLVRYEDHHPYTSEHLAMLENLTKEKLIAYFAMSGPILDDQKTIEENPDNLKCGADMVYEALIQENEWNCPAMQHLREITHHEDFASERHPTGKILTELIKGGTSKVELAQTLLKCRKKEDILKALNDKGWYEKVEKKRYEAIEIADRFMENIHLLEIERPEISGGDCGGPPLDDGSDMPVALNHRTQEDNRLRILLALAPKTKRDEPKLNIGRACEYFTDKLNNIDYLFFCYSSSLIVGRRLNQADTSINLSTLFKKLGTENDGGHAGASVCSPEKNQHYPTNILGRVSAANFANYSRYIAEKISEELKVKVINKTNISIKNSTSSLSSGGKKVIYLILAAMIVGLLVILIKRISL